MNILLGLLVIVLSAIIYSIGRVIINKEFDLNIPILPERYHDNTRLTVIQAILTMFSFAAAIQILQLIEEYLSSR